MATSYSNKERENARKIFAKHRRSNYPINECCRAAGISASTYYAWNDNDKWIVKNGWGKDDGWDK